MPASQHNDAPGRFASLLDERDLIVISASARYTGHTFNTVYNLDTHRGVTPVRYGTYQGAAKQTPCRRGIVVVLMPGSPISNDLPLCPLTSATE